MRIIKILGAAMLAVLALSAFASAASAAEYHIEGTTGPFTVKGNQVAEENHVFTVEGGLTTKCKTASFEGTAETKTVKDLTLVPVYGSCTAFGLSATVNMGTCEYTFTEPTATTGRWHAVVDIRCTKNAEGVVVPAKITTATCEVQVGEQNPGGVVQLENEATSPKTVLAKAEVTGIKYTKTKDGFLCPLNGTGEKEDGTYTGNTTVKGFEGATQKGVFVE